MNLQLYMVDSINYLVDFHHKKTYRASTEPGAGRFDMAVFDPIFSAETSSDSGRSIKEKDGNFMLREDESGVAVRVHGCSVQIDLSPCRCR